jgi:hypothetical protein
VRITTREHLEHLVTMILPSTMIKAMSIASSANKICKICRFLSGFAGFAGFFKLVFQVFLAGFLSGYQVKTTREVVA